MTAKEKAIELVEQFRNHVGTGVSGMMISTTTGDLVANRRAKECTIICVEEIQYAIDEVDEFDVQNLDRVNAWWEEVITEIEKL